MTIHLRTFNALTGGAAGALDSLTGATNGDISRVITTTGIYFYAFSSASAAAESSPDVIAPDVGTGRHLLMFKLIPMDGTQDVEDVVTFSEGLIIGATPGIYSGAGTPEAVITAPIGSVYLRTDGSTGTTLYTKVSGAGNTGWTNLTVYSDEYITGNSTVTGDLEVDGSFTLNGVLQTVTIAELNQLHSQGVVAADFAKLHAISNSATNLNNAVNTTEAQSIAGAKEFTDGLTVNGALKLGPVSSGSTNGYVHGTADMLTTIITAGDYTGVLDSGMISVKSKDHATAPRTVAIYSNGYTALETDTSGIVNLQYGLKIAGVNVSFSYTSFSPGGDLTGTILITKSFRNVTMTWQGLSHTSLSSAQSAGGAIPAAYRPIVATKNVYMMDSGSLRLIAISTDGDIAFEYDDYSGADYNTTNAGAGTISWVSAS